MTLSGGISGLAGQVVHGWLDGAGDAVVTIEILVDGRPVASAALDDSAVGLPLPAHARSFAVRLAAKPNAPARIEAYAEGQLFAILALSSAAPAYAGAVEIVGADRIDGWAIDLAAPDRLVTLDIFFGGLWVGAARTDIDRPDIAARFEACQPCGFSYSAPVFLREAPVGVFRVFIANAAIELAGSPVPRPGDATGPASAARGRLAGPG